MYSLLQPEFPAEALANLDSIASEQHDPDQIIIVVCRIDDGTFLRGQLFHNQKDRLILMARYRCAVRSKLKKSDPWLQVVEKSQLTWLSHKVRVKHRQAVVA